MNMTPEIFSFFTVKNVLPFMKIIHTHKIIKCSLSSPHKRLLFSFYYVPGARPGFMA